MIWEVLSDICIWTGLLSTFSLQPITLIWVSFDGKTLTTSSLLSCAVGKRNENSSGWQRSKLAFEGNHILCSRSFRIEWRLKKASLTLILIKLIVGDRSRTGNVSGRGSILASTLILFLPSAPAYTRKYRQKIQHREGYRVGLKVQMFLKAILSPVKYTLC